MALGLESLQGRSLRSLTGGNACFSPPLLQFLSNNLSSIYPVPCSRGPNPGAVPRGEGEGLSEGG